MSKLSFLNTEPDYLVDDDPPAAGGKAIKTRHEFPPIPIRDMDWVAYFEGDEEGGPRGWGRTEAEAISDLIENYTD